MLSKVFFFFLTLARSPACIGPSMPLDGQDALTCTHSFETRNACFARPYVSHTLCKCKQNSKPHTCEELFSYTELMGVHLIFQTNKTLHVLLVVRCEGY